MERVGEFGSDLQDLGQGLIREGMIECRINLVEGHTVRKGFKD